MAPLNSASLAFGYGLTRFKMLPHFWAHKFPASEHAKYCNELTKYCLLFTVYHIVLYIQILNCSCYKGLLLRIQKYRFMSTEQMCGYRIAGPEASRILLPQFVSNVRMQLPVERSQSQPVAGHYTVKAFHLNVNDTERGLNVTE